ncbi:Ras2p [Coprinopsis cinerea okayama7|uniref:Ras2p n=1 Tax=Coprinopsis cinerea (strain Okayama-7 / 130 / ATCC MYA-4618 / FGSC 9003) TaxID=240176 RepID=A8PE29_COPC7|nr:Ras2p [Coprinopsis cinerea okayama7\|eukprot:XP_001840714.2 Ras2p [Coprinopsis cinerea okayama7\
MTLPSGIWGFGELTEFVMGMFVEIYDPTIEDAYQRQMVLDGQMCFVEVIDTAGQADRKHDREVSREEGRAMARSFSCDFLETSAKLEKTSSGHLLMSSAYVGAPNRKPRTKKAARRKINVSYASR